MSLKSKTIFPQIPCNNKVNNTLLDLYTPTTKDIEIATVKTTNDNYSFCFIILLYSFKRLGYFAPIFEFPEKILTHVSNITNLSIPSNNFIEDFDSSRQKRRYINQIKEEFCIISFCKEKTKSLACNVARTKTSLIDIINGTIEQIINLNMELPKYDIIEGLCVNSKNKVNDQIYSKIFKRINKKTIKEIKNNILVYLGDRQTGWAKLKQDPNNISINNVKSHVEHIRWLQSIKIKDSVFEGITNVKLDSLYEESISLDFNKISRMGLVKKISIVVIAIKKRTQNYMDDIINIFINLVFSLEKQAKKDLQEYKLLRMENASYLIGKLAKIAKIYTKKIKNKIGKIDLVIGSNSESLLEMCDDFNAFDKLGYLYFFYKRYEKNYQLYSSFLKIIKPKSSEKTIDAIDLYSYWDKFIAKISNKKSANYMHNIKNSNFKLIKGRWKKLIYIKKNQIDIKKFELFLSLKLVIALKNRDVYVESSYKYSDFRNSLISWHEYEDKVENYCNIVNISYKVDDFINHLKKKLSKSCSNAEDGLDNIGRASLKNGKVKLEKVKPKFQNINLKEINNKIEGKFKDISILDIIGKVCRSLDLIKYFKSTSKIKDENELLKRIISTLFCYGCNLEASEGEKSIVDSNRRIINWVNSNYISEDALERCSTNIINIYNKFQITKYWGDGKHVSVDGTKWNTYSKNLMAEYHIRYHGYGGIAYYHVSDKYIAIYSNFISCGVHEGRYLLDALEANESDIKPEYVHGDTHAQSLVIFALAYLLGIKVMPRIKNINGLAYYKSNKADYYANINVLFKDRAINWKLISDSYHEMLRVSLSIREGKVKASEILSRISAKSVSNKLYIAFRELGRVVRTSFLMNYIGDYDLRKIIHSATCKSEEFNEYVNWISFYDKTIRKNCRLEQRKFIKYNQLVTNMVLLYNVQSMTLAINDLSKEGLDISGSVIERLSPYRKSHINRLGIYELDLEKYDDSFKKYSLEVK